MKIRAVAVLAAMTLACDGGVLLFGDDDGGHRTAHSEEPDVGAPEARASFDGGELIRWGSPKPWTPGPTLESSDPAPTDRFPRLGTSCIERCVPVDNPCAGVDCGPGETCLKGACVTGCFFEPCQGIDCADGFYCASGRCLPLIPCSRACPDGQSCHLVCPPVTDACKDVVCGDCRRCVDGACTDDPCSCLSCEAGQFCEVQAGKATCKSSCDCPEACAENEICELGSCVLPQANRPGCRPDCTNKACGSDDGCGGTCLSGACGEGQICKQGACECQPSCEGKACGADDGCGNACQSGACDGNDKCVKGSCQCQPTCSGKQCGGDDGCGNPCQSGSCDSPAEFSCSRGECVCKPDYVKQLCLQNKLACGAQEDSCGQKCLVGSCAPGKTCSNGSCVCTREAVDAKCAAKGLSCGATESECGMKCYVGSCAGDNEFCDRGTCRCDKAQACEGKQCGEQADGCGGTVACDGSCRAGYSCDTRYLQCRCTPETLQARCAAQGLECGATEGACGMTCLSGACDGRNEFCQRGGCQCNKATACAGKRCGEYAEGCPGVRCTGCDTGYSCDAGSWQCKCTAQQRVQNCQGKACGASDGCGGTCSSGACSGAQEVCRNDQCVCIPRCEACGASDGCNGSCKTGSCPGEEFCVAGACALTCPCGQKVKDHRCVDICSPTETPCGCNSCCAPGKACVDPSRGLCGSDTPF